METLYDCAICKDRTATAWICDGCVNVEAAKPKPLKFKFAMNAAPFEPQSAGDEKALIVKAQNGDGAALQELVSRNIRLPLSVAAKHVNNRDDGFADAMQEAVIGLITAIRLFDPAFKVRLSTYATIWARSRVYRYLLANRSAVKPLTTQARRRLFFGINKARRAIEKNGNAPTRDAIADTLGASIEDVEAVIQFLDCRDESIDDLLDAGWDVACDSSPESSFARAEMSALVRDASARIAGDREQRILKRRWLADDPDSLQMIGDHYGLSRERVRQIERRALNSLWKGMQAVAA